MKYDLSECIKALEYYADRNNYFRTYDNNLDIPIVKERGKKARKALKKDTEMGGRVLNKCEVDNLIQQVNTMRFERNYFKRKYNQEVEITRGYEEALREIEDNTRIVNWKRSIKIAREALKGFDF